MAHGTPRPHRGQRQRLDDAGVGAVHRFALEERDQVGAQAVRSGHLIDVDGHEHLLEQIDRPVLEGMDAEAIEALNALDAVETRA